MSSAWYRRPKPAFPGEPETPQPTVAIARSQTNRRQRAGRAVGTPPPARRGAAPEAGVRVVARTVGRGLGTYRTGARCRGPGQAPRRVAEVPELWVENFVTVPNLKEAGLDKPERTVKVETDKRTVDLQIGKVSREVEKKAPPPPPPQFGASTSAATAPDQGGLPLRQAGRQPASFRSQGRQARRPVRRTGRDSRSAASPVSIGRCSPGRDRPTGFPDRPDG